MTGIITESAQSNLVLPAHAPAIGEDEAKRLLTERVTWLNERTALVKAGNSVLFLSDDHDGEPVQLLTRAGLVAKHEGFTIAYTGEQGRERTLSPVRHWLNNNKRTYKKMDYRPAGADEGVFNLFQGWGVQPSTEGSCQLFLEHVRENVCCSNQEYYDFLLDWMADIFQNPERKHNTALVLQGPQGTGKTFFAKVLGRLAGEQNFITVDSTRKLLGNFNRHLSGKMIIFADEAIPPRDLGERGRLKTLISDDTIAIEPKGRDAFTISNFARVIFASNSDEVIPAENGERRYFVLRLSGTRANDTAYFGAIDRQLSEGGYGALMRLFMERRIMSDLRVAPRTPYLHEQMLLRQDPTQAWFQEKLIAGLIQGEIPLDELHQTYSRQLSVAGERPKNKILLAREIRHLFPDCQNEQRWIRPAGTPCTERRRINVVHFGPLDRCRSSFERVTGIPIEIE